MICVKMQYLKCICEGANTNVNCLLQTTTLNLFSFAFEVFL